MLNMRTLKNWLIYSSYIALAGIGYAICALMIVQSTVNLFQHPPKMVSIVSKASILPQDASKTVSAPTSPPVVYNQTGKPSQAQKDATADVCRNGAEQYKEKYTKFGISPEQFKTECYLTLLSIVQHESNFDCSVVGDNSRSFGCTQIRIDFASRHLTKEMVQDYRFAITWSLNHLVHNGFPRMYHRALVSYNGAGKHAENYAIAVKKTIEQYRVAGY